MAGASHREGWETLNRQKILSITQKQMNGFLLSFVNQVASELIEFSPRNNISERGREGESYIINY